MLDQSKRIYVIDYLKAFAIIAVILNHSVPYEMKNSFFMVFVLRMAVPIFILTSGYNFAKSISKRDSLLGWYSMPKFAYKILNLGMPILIVYTIWLVLQRISGADLNLWFGIKSFIFAVFGDGSYYFWIVLQMLFIFPLIYAIAIKFQRGGVLSLIVIDILIEISLYMFPIPLYIYRICAVRYIALLSMGCYTFIMGDKNIKTKNLIISFLIGALYLGFYMNFSHIKRIYKYSPWENSNVFSLLYIYPIFYCIIKKLRYWKLNNVFHKIFGLIGQSTWYIMCLQMMWFWKAHALYMKINTPLVLQMIMNVFICCFSGCLIKVLTDKIKADFSAGKIKEK